jgi:hypothetical protein
VALHPRSAAPDRSLGCGQLPAGDGSWCGQVHGEAASAVAVHHVDSAARRLKPVEAGEHQVQKEQDRRVDERVGRPGPAVGAGTDPLALVLQIAAHQLGDGGVVVRDQQMATHRRLLTARDVLQPTVERYACRAAAGRTPTP